MADMAMRYRNFTGWLKSPNARGYIFAAILVVFAVPGYVYQYRGQQEAYHKSLNAIYKSQLKQCSRGSTSRRFVADLSGSVSLLSSITDQFLRDAATSRQLTASAPGVNPEVKSNSLKLVVRYNGYRISLAKHPVKVPPAAVICKKVIPDPNNLNALASKEKT